MQKQSVINEMLVAPRAKLVTLRPRKTKSNFWGRVRVFGGLWALETGLRYCWMARRALDVRDLYNAVPQGYFVFVLVTFVPSSCHEEYFAVVK